MILSKNHPVIIQMGDIQTGNIYLVSGVRYEVIDQNFSSVEVDITNPIVLWKKKRSRKT